MKIPKTFSIKGKEWSITYKWSLKADDGDRVEGLCDFGERTILLDRLLSQEEKFNALVHELIHAALYEAHLNHTSGLGAETEEIVVESIRDMLMSLFDLKWKKPK